MTQTTTVRVALDGRGYDIVIGGAVLDSCGERVAKLAGHGRVVVVTDGTSTINDEWQNAGLNYALENIAERVPSAELVAALGG